MRQLLILSAFVVLSFGPSHAEPEQLIGQLGKNSTETGERSSASLDQIGKRTVETNGLVNQIDPSQVSAASRDAATDDNVEISGRSLASGDCSIGPDQQAMINYLRIEGRVFEDNCQLLDWLEGEDADEPTDRELFEVTFGTEAQRLKQVEQDRLQQEQADAEARARMLDAMLPPADG